MNARHWGDRGEYRVSLYTQSNSGSSGKLQQYLQTVSRGCPTGVCSELWAPRVGLNSRRVTKPARGGDTWIFC